MRLLTPTQQRALAQMRVAGGAFARARATRYSMDSPKAWMSAPVLYLISLTITVTTSPLLIAALIKSVALALSAVTSPVVIKQIGKLMAITTTTAPTLLKRISKAFGLSSTTAPVLSAIRMRFATLAVTVATVPALIRQVGKLVVVTTTTAPAFVRQARKILGIASTTAPSLLASKVKAVLLAVTATTIPSLVATFQKGVSAIFVFVRGAGLVSDARLPTPRKPKKRRMDMATWKEVSVNDTSLIDLGILDAAEMLALDDE